MQDGQAISPSERIQARQAWQQLHEQLRQELRAEGVDIEAASHAEDDSLADADEIPETGYALHCNMLLNLAWLQVPALGLRCRRHGRTGCRSVRMVTNMLHVASHVACGKA